jgi:predicted RNase H-like HicB family nuclease
MQYSVVIEKTDNGYSAYAPDLPGCIAAGDSQVEVEELIREAIIMHLESLREHGDPVPEPQTSVALVEV